MGTDKFIVSQETAKKLVANEKRRGCGFRQVGSLYLCGTGFAVECDGLPLILKACECCGFEIPFFRGFKWISKKYIEKLSKEKHDVPIIVTDKAGGNAWCNCFVHCPVCHPENNNHEKYGFMWVGNKFYTPKTFITESDEMGVSKKIAMIPKGLVLGETWVLLAHPKHPVRQNVTQDKLNKLGTLAFEPEYKPAIFYAFRPTRIEMPIWKRHATPDFLERLKKQGVTPVIIPDDDLDHAPSKKKAMKQLDDYYEMLNMEIELTKQGEERCQSKLGLKDND
jgi:hypothetical protein